MKKLNIILTIVLIALLLASTGGFFNKGGIVVQTDTIMRSDTLYLRDTFTVNKPVPYIVEKVKTDTVYKSNGDTLHLVTETKKYEENVIQDQDTAVITAQITGINANLDTLSVMFNRREVTNTVEITKIVKKKKTFKDRFHIGLQVGYGIGLKTKEFEPYAGVGGSFDL